MTKRIPPMTIRCTWRAYPLAAAKEPYLLA